MTEPRGPIDAARRQQTEREQQPARKLLDQMNDRELTKLYDRLDQYRASRRRWIDSANRDRACANALGERITRVAALVASVAEAELPHGYDNSERAVRDFAREILAVLYDPKEV